MNGVGDARVAHVRPEWFAPPNHGFAWIRMIGALLVIYGHSSPLVGSGELFPPDWPIQPDEGVLMGFFAMSGFQITESWLRDPHPVRFATKRVLRLWPPMLTVSFGMALIIGPVVTSLAPSDYFATGDTWGYIVNNAGLLGLQHELPGVFPDNPWPDAVNGSLWTLPMELLAYGGLFALLLLGAARERWRWLAIAALIALIAWDRRLEELPGAESAGSLLSVPVESLVAFLVAFAAGVVLNLHRVPLSPTAALAGLAVLVLMPNSIVGSFWMTFAVSYAVVVAGHFWPARLEVPGTWVNGSYGVYVWGFPVQQLLAMGGIRNQYLMLLCAAPIAYVLGTLSWKFVEEPTMQLRHYITPAPRAKRAGAGAQPDGAAGRDGDRQAAAPASQPRPVSPQAPPPTPRPAGPGSAPDEESVLVRRSSGELPPQAPAPQPPRAQRPGPQAPGSYRPPTPRHGPGWYATDQAPPPETSEEETRPMLRRPPPRPFDSP